MPKMKTNKSVKSRFKVTGSGKLMHNRAGRRHKLEKKSAKKKRYLATEGVIDKSIEKKFKIMMGV